MALLLGATAAAQAVSAAIDPACADFAIGGFVQVGDLAELGSDLPSGVTVDDMSCVLDYSASGEDIRIFAYLSDPFAVFLDKAAFFAARGWTATEALDDDAEVPADLAALPAREGEGEISLVFRRGASGAGLSDATDSAEATFGIGTFLAVSEEGAVAGATGGVLLISAALLTLLLAVPAFLLSRVLSARYDRWFGWLDRGRLGRLREELAQPRSAAPRWVMLGVGMLLASFIAAFIDPRFGFNGLSVRLHLTLLVTFVIFSVGAWAVVTLVMRRVQPDARPTLRFHPASLLVVAVAVALSRLLQFDPGVVVGLVAATTFAVALDAGSVALTELLGGLTLEGVATLPIALIPLATLDGGILFRWKRRVWAVVYAAGMALFLLVLLVLFDLPGGDVPVDQGFWNWLVVLGVFAVIAIGVWAVDLFLRRQKPRETPVA